MRPPARLNSFGGAALPSCCTYYVNPRLLLTNLLQNSWKYSRHSDHARIELGVGKDESGIQTYYVRDNGIGFQHEERERIFRVFERLHTAEEYKGTGLGLATVERIVHRHGGRVWAEGTPGEGAVFRFTLESSVDESDANQT